MYGRPITKRHAYYHEEDEDDEVEEYEMNHKRQKPSKPVSGYDCAGPSDAKLAYDWTEQEAFVLLEIWGDRFLQLGRRSLRNDDWNEVAEKVSEELRIEKSETQCRRMMDILKRKYKKEKTKVEKLGLGSSKWSFFNKMDMLLGFSPKSDLGLACGVDSGEFVFMNSKIYLDKSNGFDAMMDSPGDSEDEEEKVEVDYRRRKLSDSASYLLLADSVERFGKIYEKIEKSEKEQMREVEKMRSDFQNDLELQKKQILGRAQVEIARLRQQENDDYHDDDDDSALNLSDE